MTAATPQLTPDVSRVAAAPAAGVNAAWTPPMVRPGVQACMSACCCPAPPLYQVVMPPRSGRQAVELLLCGHHFRTSIEAVSTASMWVYDANGRLLDSCR